MLRGPAVDWGGRGNPVNQATHPVEAIMVEARKK